MMGLFFGAAMGLICWVLPSKRKQGPSLRLSAMLLTAGLFIFFGSRKIEFFGGGALAVLTMGFVAAEGFRRQGWGDGDNPVGQHLIFVWGYFQPMLDGLIGAEMQLREMDLHTVGLGLAMLCISLTCRLVTTFYMTLGTGFNIKERIFVAIALIPKATVQITIGAMALEHAIRIGADEQEIALANQIRTISWVTILFAANIGAIVTTLSASKLLQSSCPPSHLNNV
ncbi:sodium/hydrogen exchanger 9B2 [Hyalella azteca]|uniref:Sodium/hydrogen exchanger 9B2 n=1 Tax=Hyalella azteca TaxID=294128 RepID=A0A8B7NTJ6_HYAAZ|nr:sodium/hydrogen exchanger 9B2 [Hyalella azteca]